MGKRRFLSCTLLLAVWTLGVMSNPGRPGLESYLPKETFIIHDVNYNLPMAPEIPVSTPLLQRSVSPLRSSIPGLFSQQQSVSPQRSFQPSSSPQQQSNNQRRPTMPVETPQRQTNLSPPNAFMPTNSNQQRPSQHQFGFTPQRDIVPSRAPQQQSTVTQQRPFMPVSTLQQHLDFATQRPTVPSPVHSNAPQSVWMPITTTRQPSRVEQSAGNFQQPSSTQQTNHRFSSTMRSVESQRQPASQHNIPQSHQTLVDSGYRQSPMPQENTIRRPSNRHNLCGVLPPSGDCRAAFPRYYYNNQTDQCDCFLYGGCGSQGLKHSYRTLEECHNTCSPSRKEEGPTCKEIYYEDEVFLDTQNHNLPQAVPPVHHNLPRPFSTSSQRYSPVDTSHIPDKPLIILLVNSANQVKRETNDFNSNSNSHE